MLYDLGFKSGSIITIDIDDVTKFMSEYRRVLMTDSLTANHGLLAMHDRIIMASELEFILPSATVR